MRPIIFQLMVNGMVLDFPLCNVLPIPETVCRTDLPVWLAANSLMTRACLLLFYPFYFVEHRKQTSLNVLSKFFRSICIAFVFMSAATRCHSALWVTYHIECDLQKWMCSYQCASAVAAVLVAAAAAPYTFV